MNLLQLEYFQVVAKEQSITKAARALDISQSALSIMMNKLETEIGYPLFQRQGRNIVITPYGRDVLYYSYILLHEMEDIQREFQELRGESNERKLTLGVTDSNYYGDWILGLLEQYPDIQLNVLQMSRAEIYEHLIMGNLDFGISNEVEYHGQLSAQLLFSQPYQLLVLREHPLADKGKITVEELMQEPIISLPPSHKERMIDNLSQEMHFRPNIIFEGNPDIMAEMFHAGVGSILTCAHNRKQWMMRAPEQYAMLDIVGANSRYEMYLLWSKHRYLSKWARIFQRYVFDYYHV
ncbi:MAG: LysR family transcriptional regulator [Peptococcaceae bacterium]